MPQNLCPPRIHLGTPLGATAHPLTTQGEQFKQFNNKGLPNKLKCSVKNVYVEFFHLSLQFIIYLACQLSNEDQ